MLIYRDLVNASKAVFGHRVVMSEQLPNFSWAEDFLQDVVGGCQVRNFAGRLLKLVVYQLPNLCCSAHCSYFCILCLRSPAALTCFFAAGYFLSGSASLNFTASGTPWFSKYILEPTSENESELNICFNCTAKLRDICHPVAHPMLITTDVDVTAATCVLWGVHCWVSSSLLDGKSDRADTPFSVVVSECLIFGMVIALIPCYVQIFPLIGVFANLRKATISFAISDFQHETTQLPLRDFREIYFNIFRNFDVHVTVHRDKFLVINQLDVVISQIYFGRKLYIFRTVPLSIIRKFFTVHTAMVYAIQVCWQLACCQQTCMTRTIAACTIENSWWWTEELLEACRVSFQNKFEK